MDVNGIHSFDMSTVLALYKLSGERAIIELLGIKPSERARFSLVNKGFSFPVEKEGPIENYLGSPDYCPSIQVEIQCLGVALEHQILVITDLYSNIESPSLIHVRYTTWRVISDGMNNANLFPTDRRHDIYLCATSEDIKNAILQKARAFASKQLFQSKITMEPVILDPYQFILPY